MTAFSGHKDLAAGTVLTSPSPAISGTTVTLQSGQGAQMPATVPFYATACPADVLASLANAELLRVTAVVGDVLTIARAQGGTSAKTIAVGWLIFASVSSLWADQVEDAINELETNTSVLEDAAADEAAARADADAALGDDLDSETATRLAADLTLANAIADEETTRTSIDANLADAIDAEETARISADAGKAASVHAHSGADITSGTVAEARIDALIARDSEVTAAIAAALSTLAVVYQPLDDDLTDLAATNPTAFALALLAIADQAGLLAAAGAAAASHAHSGADITSGTVVDARIDSAIARVLVQTNTQTASYGLVLADAAKAIEMNVASANNLTVPLNSTQAFSIGTLIEIFQLGAGQTTIVATGGVTIRSAGGRLKLTAQYSSAVLRKRGTDEWVAAGDLTT